MRTVKKVLKAQQTIEGTELNPGRAFAYVFAGEEISAMLLGPRAMPAESVGWLDTIIL
jgi:hypothetical protein